MKKKTVEESKTIISRVMMPSDANSNGYVHGGTILKMADTTAGVCASRHAGNYCVTASVDRVDFHEPIKIGELVTMLASVNFVGKTSMEIGIKVLAENIVKCKIKHANSCYYTMVSVDKKGKPKKVPKLIVKSKEEKRRYKEAEIRRNTRLRKFKKKKRR